MPRKGVNTHGWLYEDGVLDLQAAFMAASGKFKPTLTYREGLIAVFLMTRRGLSQARISEQLDIPRCRAWEMVQKIKSNLDEYESLLSEESSRTSR